MSTQTFGKNHIWRKGSRTTKGGWLDPNPDLFAEYVYIKMAIHIYIYICTWLLLPLGTDVLIPYWILLRPVGHHSVALSFALQAPKARDRDEPRPYHQVRENLLWMLACWHAFLLGSFWARLISLFMHALNLCSIYAFAFPCRSPCQWAWIWFAKRG